MCVSANVSREETPVAYDDGRQGSVVAAALWMMLISILLFWLPVFGPLIAGFIGGRIAGSASRGFTAAILPAIVVLVLAIVIGGVFGFPLYGLLAGGILFVVALVHAVPVILGALIGGALARTDYR
jgi:hypothetical protein